MISVKKNRSAEQLSDNQDARSSEQTEGAHHSRAPRASRITAAWIKQWLYCLHYHPAYFAYCTAKQTSDDVRCIELEDKYERISDIFSDWGNIYQTQPLRNAKQTNAWIDEHYDLFFNRVEIKNILDPTKHSYRPGHIILDIELSEDIEFTIEKVKAAIYHLIAPEFHYMLHTGKTSGRIPFKPLPKYSLHGECTNATLGRVKKAICVARPILVARQVRTTRPSITDTILIIKKMKVNPFGWEMTRSDVDAERRGMFNKSYDGSSEKVQIIKHRKDFNALVRNVIHGRFPDFT